MQKPSFFERITDRSFLLTIGAMCGVYALILQSVSWQHCAVFVGSAFIFTFPEKIKDAAALVAQIRGMVPATVNVGNAENVNTGGGEENGKDTM